MPRYPITIDDGPHPESTIQWLELLDTLEQKAIFFLRGDRSVKYASLTDEIRRRGHYVGSHGFRHLHGWTTNSKPYIKDTEKSLDVLETNIFRPPYGRLTFSQYRILKSLTQIVMWSVMPGDFDPKVSPAQMANRIHDVTDRDIVVFHDHPSSFAKASKILSQLSFVDKSKQFI